MMLQRAMQILAEAGQVWPLASRWLEILEKFARDNKGVLAGVEGSMADSVSTAFPWSSRRNADTDQTIARPGSGGSPTCCPVISGLGSKRSWRQANH